KRTARIVSNAILIANQYCPISFRTIDSVEYKKAMLIFYEQNNISVFKKIFMEQFRFAVKTYFLCDNSTNKVSNLRYLFVTVLREVKRKTIQSTPCRDIRYIVDPLFLSPLEMQKVVFPFGRTTFSICAPTWARTRDQKIMSLLL